MENKNIKGAFIIMYVDESIVAELDKEYYCYLPEYSGDNINIPMKITSERDSNGVPIIKDGYAKMYLYSISRVGPHFMKEEITNENVDVCIHLTKPGNDYYSREWIKVPKNKVKFFPLNKDWKYILMKDKRSDLLLNEKIW